ncbi:MAG: efflux RND transporter periplasmic adaptor subunit [Thermodesulfobacteriaceae bacterium]|nr:efflux RND transporter periplasmic adaptor subunit [Thermodesulfobacteriaceae bacterium]MCX8041664.1 efflux RND transporter periplasmic adaptor subunit [Thermodesulfobacteriaceae bacterium]MDW8135316.1 efflux RND transporter periplasmic adaptor subunit [Thermodesulfobacterium sp.]
MKGFFLYLLVIVFFLSGCKKEPKNPENFPKETTKVERGDIFLEVTVTGAIKPQVGAQVKVGARISGRVEKLFVKQGDRVKAGQLIAIIEHRELQEGVNRTYANYQEALANMEKVKKTYPPRIQAQKKKIEALSIELKQIERELKRYETLYKEGLISLTDLERLKRDYEVRKAQLDSEDSTLSALLEEYEKELERTKAQVSSTKNAWEEAKVKLNYAFVYTPISGVVSEVTTQQGETVVAGLNAPTFITVIDLSKLQVECYVDETDIGKISPGQSATFTVDAYPEKVFKAKVRTIYPGAIIKNNVVFYDVVLDILDPYEGILRPEMTAQVIITAGKKENVLVIPSRAVKIDPQGSHYVMVKVGEKWEKRLIKVGWESRGKTEIISGLKEGEEVGLW